MPERPEGCPWPDANLFLGGRMHALDGTGELGIAQACACVPGPLEPGTEVPFYAEFHFDDGGRYRAEGVAHVLSNDVPVPNVVIAACALRLVGGVDGLRGGAVTSTSVFNPTREPGIETGSIWTLVASVER